MYRVLGFLLLALCLHAAQVEASSDPTGPAISSDTSSTHTDTDDAATSPIKTDATPVPPSLDTILATDTGDTELAPENLLQIRKDALVESAISFGARGGLAHRTFEIQRRLAENEPYLSKIFSFNSLLIPEQTGLLIEPPIVSEGQKAIIVSGGGQAAAVADRIYKIGRDARIVTAARDWRSYLERDWGEVKPPPDLLLPKNDEERKIWNNAVRKGWDEGIKQADEIFQADLDKLTNDFTGMVRYRQLLAQNMITAPYALYIDRGVTGNSDQMRIGDKSLTITGPSALNPRPLQWAPTPQ